MCTLTAVPTPTGVRVAFNRDELRSRPLGLPPAVRSIGGRLAAFPTDPVSGGTWLAATDAGLVLAVLNVNRPGAPAAGRVSRGAVIPGVLQKQSPRDAVGAVERGLVVGSFAPFRLVAVGGEEVADLVWDGRRVVVGSRPLDAPVVFTSSGLGDHLVERARCDLSDAAFAGPAAGWAAAQDAFHRHRWPDRSELSVNMSRADARTVSHAVVEVGRQAADFLYHPDAPDRPAEPTVVELPVVARAVP